MAAFYVGQRVRLAICDEDPTEIGKEGRITDFEVLPIGHVCADGFSLTEVSDCGVLWDTGEWLAEMTYRLEPILDTSLEACEDEFKRDLDKLLKRQAVPA